MDGGREIEFQLCLPARHSPSVVSNLASYVPWSLVLPILRLLTLPYHRKRPRPHALLCFAFMISSKIPIPRHVRSEKAVDDVLTQKLPGLMVRFMN